MILLGVFSQQSPSIPPVENDPFFANVSSLMHYDSDFSDETGKSWTVEGSATITSSESVFGGGSLSLPSTGAIVSPSSPDFAYGAGDFTVELFVKFNNFLGNQYALDHGSNRGALSTAGAGRLSWYNSSTGISSPIYTTGTGTLTAGVWYHIAIVRSAGVTSVYTDGVLKSQGSDAYSYGSQVVTVGRYGAGGNPLNGFIDELRITKGVARYTANFTPPSAPFPNT